MLTPIKAIRAKCLDCCCGSAKEVELCPIPDCTLYPYRFGKNPNIKREVTQVQLASLEKARLSRKSMDRNSEKTHNTTNEGNYTPKVLQSQQHGEEK